MTKAKQAVQDVRDSLEAFRANVKKMNEVKGAEYEQTKLDDKTLWDASRAAKQALRDHVYKTYGVSLYDLKTLADG